VVSRCRTDQVSQQASLRATSCAITRRISLQFRIVFSVHMASPLFSPQRTLSSHRTTRRHSEADAFCRLKCAFCTPHESAGNLSSVLDFPQRNQPGIQMRVRSGFVRASRRRFRAGERGAALRVTNLQAMPSGSRCTRGPLRLRHVAPHELPILGLGEHFSRSVDERPMREAVRLKLIHEPRRGIAKISIDAVHAANRD